MITRNADLKVTDELKREVARRFIVRVVDDATKYCGHEHILPMGKVISQLNSEEPHAGICHSHDFCDSNMSMQAALESCGLDVDALFEESEDAGVDGSIHDLWNGAWDLAKAAGFDASKV